MVDVREIFVLDLKDAKTAHRMAEVIGSTSPYRVTVDEEAGKVYVGISGIHDVVHALEANGAAK
jgi:hypothetical protein